MFDRLAEWRRAAALSLRHLRRAPGFAALLIVTLGIGIGATASIFSVVYAVVLRPLPFAEPERIVRVHPQLNNVDEGCSAPLFLAWQEHVRSFAAIGASEFATFTLVDETNCRSRLAEPASAPTISPCSVSVLFWGESLRVTSRRPDATRGGAGS
jgi:hypothetical protein